MFDKMSSIREISDVTESVVMLKKSLALENSNEIVINDIGTLLNYLRHYKVSTILNFSYFFVLCLKKVCEQVKGSKCVFIV